MKLSDKETIALNRLQMGGVDAWRTPGYNVACRTINSLLHKKLIDKNGLTAKGLAVVETFDASTPIT